MKSRFEKVYLFQKNSDLVKRSLCTRKATETYQSLKRCNRTVSLRCDVREFSKVYKVAKNCMKGNCNKTPKKCKTYKAFNRIKTKRKECRDTPMKGSYKGCMQIIKDEVPTILEYCRPIYPLSLCYVD